MDLAIPLQHVGNLLLLHHLGVNLNGVVLGEETIGLFTVVHRHLVAVVQDAWNPWKGSLNMLT